VLATGVTNLGNLYLAACRTRSPRSARGSEAPSEGGQAHDRTEAPIVSRGWRRAARPQDWREAL